MRGKLMRRLVAPAVMCVLAVTGAAVTTTSTATAQQQPAAGHAPACPHGITPTLTTQAAAAAPFAAPPAGFNPLTAPAADLARYGFPPRPDAAHESGWRNAMTAWRRTDPAGAVWTCGSTTKALGTGNTGNSPNWAGNEDQPSVGGIWQNGVFTAAQLEWTAPQPAPDWGNTGSDTEISIWPGVGHGTGSGASSTDQMIQAGTETDYSPGNGYYTTLSIFWYEIFPKESAHYVSTPSVSPGQNVYVEVYYAGTTAYFFLENLSTGSSRTYPEAFNGLSGRTAEWIVEKSGPVPLPEWSGALMMNYAQADAFGTWVCAGTQTHTAWRMVYNSSLIAYPSAWTDPGSYCNFPIYRTGSIW